MHLIDHFQNFQIYLMTSLWRRQNLKVKYRENHGRKRLLLPHIRNPITLCIYWAIYKIFKFILWSHYDVIKILKWNNVRTIADRAYCCHTYETLSLFAFTEPFRKIYKWPSKCRMWQGFICRAAMSSICYGSPVISLLNFDDVIMTS